VLRKEMKEVLGERREYLMIKILHNDMTVMVPTENWNRRFKHNRDKIKTGDIYELAEVVRNLAVRESQKGLSTGEKQMFTRAKKILASELMYALEMDEEQVEEHLHELLLEQSHQVTGNGTLAVAAE
jgi:CarD family transcriptional regulator